MHGLRISTIARWTYKAKQHKFMSLPKWIWNYPQFRAPLLLLSLLLFITIIILVTTSPKLVLEHKNISVQIYSIQSTPKRVKPSKKKSWNLHKSKTFSCEYRRKSQYKIIACHSLECKFLKHCEKWFIFHI